MKLTYNAVYNMANVAMVPNEVVKAAENRITFLIEAKRWEFSLLSDKKKNSINEKDPIFLDSLSYDEVVKIDGTPTTLRRFFQGLAKDYGLYFNKGLDSVLADIAIVDALAYQSQNYGSLADKPVNAPYFVHNGGRSAVFIIHETAGPLLDSHRKTPQEIYKIHSHRITGHSKPYNYKPAPTPARQLRKQDKQVSVGTSLSEPLAKALASTDPAVRMAALQAEIDRQNAELQANLTTTVETPPAPPTLTKAQKKALKKGQAAAAANPQAMGNGNTLPPNAPSVPPPPPATLAPLSQPLPSPVSIPGLPS